MHQRILDFRPKFNKMFSLLFFWFLCLKLPSEDDVESMLSYINGFISEMRNYLIVNSSSFKHAHTHAHTHTHTHHTHTYTQTSRHEDAVLLFFTLLLSTV